MNKETIHIGIHIGAMCDPIHKQLRGQGISVSKANVSHFQRAHDGFVQLRVLGCFGDKEADRIGHRLVNAITRFVKNNPQLIENK
jgi:hypothetical protein